jgi:hypothetical protein
MIIRYAAMILSVAASLALLLGLLFWAGIAMNFISLHMLLGLLAVAALWLIGVGQAIVKGGSWAIAIVVLVIGALTLYVGLYQSAMMVGPAHGVIQVIHLILGVLIVGLGHMATARYRRNQS